MLERAACCSVTRRSYYLQLPIQEGEGSLEEFSMACLGREELWLLGFTLGKNKDKK